jgi:hypothetical protein
MSFEDVVSKADWTKVFMFEVQPAKRIDTESWTQHGVYANCWRIDYDEIVVEVEEDGSAYTECLSLLELDNLSGGMGFYYDEDNEYLWVHTSGASNPGASGAAFLVAYHWEYYTNIQDEDEPVIYNGHYYLPYLRSEDLPDIEQAVSDYYEGGINLGFGDIKLINADGYFDTRLSAYVYEWKNMKLKVGNLGAAYLDVATLWIGITGNIEWSDEEVIFEILDPREQ